MNIGVYCHIGHKAGRAIIHGFQLLGHTAVIRTAKYWRGEVEGFDLVVVGGAHSGRKVARAYQKQGVPVLVFDWGYVKRVNTPEEHDAGHWQVGVGSLNQIAAQPCPPDRFDALGVNIEERGGDSGGYVLVCGQVPGDAAHGLGYDGYKQWLLSTFENHPGCVYRPHPMGAPLISHPRTDCGPLEDALAGAKLVVTYNSNIGHDALLAGVPVIADGPTAYKELEGETLPSLDARREYFSRVAYSQWTLDEIRSGEPIEYWLANLDSSDDEPSAEDQPSRRDFLLGEIERLSGKRPGARSKDDTLEQRYAELAAGGDA